MRVGGQGPEPIPMLGRRGAGRSPAAAPAPAAPRLQCFPKGREGIDRAHMALALFRSHLVQRIQARHPKGTDARIIVVVVALPETTPSCIVDESIKLYKRGGSAPGRRGAAYPAPAPRPGRLQFSFRRWAGGRTRRRDQVLPSIKTGPAARGAPALAVGWEHGGVASRRAGGWVGGVSPRAAPRWAARRALTWRGARHWRPGRAQRGA